MFATFFTHGPFIDICLYRYRDDVNDRSIIVFVGHRYNIHFTHCSYTIIISLLLLFVTCRVPIPIRRIIYYKTRVYNRVQLSADMHNIIVRYLVTIIIYCATSTRTHTVKKSGELIINSLGRLQNDLHINEK